MLGYLILFLDTQLTVCSIAAGKKTNSSSVYLFNSVTEFMRLLYFRKPLEQEFIECYLKDFENLYDALDEPVELQICQFLKSVADYFNLTGDEVYYHQKKLREETININLKSQIQMIFSSCLQTDFGHTVQK